MGLAQGVIVALLVSAVVVWVAAWRQWLSRSGAAAALVVGTFILGFGGWQWALLLGWFFVSSSLLSRFKEADKQKAAEKFDKGSERDAMQVLANGGLGALIALCSAIWPSELWFVFFVGVMGAVSADTYATELGTLSKTPPRLITNLRPVDVGTSGGISPLGTLVSLGGGLLIGILAGLVTAGQFGALMAAGAIGGLLGSLTDSVLGATIQQIYWCDTCGKDTEKQIHGCQTHTRPLRGWSWMNNDAVNLIASIIGGLVALGIYTIR